MNLRQCNYMTTKVIKADKTVPHLFWVFEVVKFLQNDPRDHNHRLSIVCTE